MKIEKSFAKKCALMQRIVRVCLFGTIVFMFLSSALTVTVSYSWANEQSGAPQNAYEKIVVAYDSGKITLDEYYILLIQAFQSPNLLPPGFQPDEGAGREMGHYLT